jgi:broad specificity phosphatase PhoE
MEGQAGPAGARIEGAGPVTVKLLFIRHARPDLASRDFRDSPRGRQWDPPLDETGRRQAEILADRLRAMSAPAAVFASPFRRCQETIQPFLTASRMEARADEDLGEVFIGRWEGMSFEEIVSGDEELARRFREQEAMFSMAPGGESGSELRARVLPAVERIVGAVRNGVVLVVTHGGVINAYLGHVLALDQDLFFLPDHASINTVRVDDGRPEVRFLNDVRHLTDPALFVPPAGAES